MRPFAISGCAYTCPSSVFAKRRRRCGCAGAPATTPAREFEPPKVVQLPAAEDGSEVPQDASANASSASARRLTAPNLSERQRLLAGRDLDALCGLGGSEDQRVRLV